MIDTHNTCSYLMRLVDEQAHRAERAEEDAALYRQAFAFLLAQPDFAPLQPRLRNHMKHLLPS